MTGTEAEREDDAALAAEFVLGLLPAGEARAFEARLNTEPELRALVAQWTENLVTLTDDIAPVTPPDRVRTALGAQLFPETPAARASRSPLRYLVGLVSGAVAALALVIAVSLVVPPASGPTLQARIANEEVGLIVLASLDPGGATLTVIRSAGAPPSGRSLELWLIPAGSSTPVSLGVVDPAEIRVAVPPELRAGLAGGTLAISEEPQGGSPTGTPTKVLGAGPVETV